MKAFNHKTGRYLGEIQSEAGDNLLILNQYKQTISVPKVLVIFDEQKAKKLEQQNFKDPEERAMNQALSTEAYVGAAYRTAKFYFRIAFFVCAGSIGILVLFHLMGFSGPPIAGWAAIASFGFMFSHGIRLLKYRNRLKK